MRELSGTDLLALDQLDTEFFFEKAMGMNQNSQSEDRHGYLILSAGMGNEKALYELGHDYLNGNGCKEDFSKALGMFRICASKGFGPAHIELARMARVAADEEMVIYHYKKGYDYIIKHDPMMEIQYPDMLVELGLYYHEKEEFMEAYHILSRAFEILTEISAESEDEFAEGMLEKVEQTLSSTEYDYFRDVYEDENEIEQLTS